MRFAHTARWLGYAALPHTPRAGRYAYGIRAPETFHCIASEMLVRYTSQILHTTAMMASSIS